MLTTSVGLPVNLMTTWIEMVLIIAGIEMVLIIDMEIIDME